MVFVFVNVVNFLESTKVVFNNHNAWSIDDKSNDLFDVNKLLDFISGLLKLTCVFKIGYVVKLGNALTGVIKLEFMFNEVNSVIWLLCKISLSELVMFKVVVVLYEHEKSTKQIKSNMTLNNVVINVGSNCWYKLKL